MVAKERRKFERFTLETKNKAYLASIGSSLIYALQTRNISKKGLFLSCEDPERYPFTTSSLLEVSLDIGDGQSVFFNAKPVRFFSPFDNQASLWGPGLAIKIVQISEGEDKKLEKFLKDLSEKS